MSVMVQILCQTRVQVRMVDMLLRDPIIQHTVMDLCKIQQLVSEIRLSVRIHFKLTLYEHITRLLDGLPLLQPQLTQILQ